MKKFVPLAIVCFVLGVVNATVWNPAANGIYPPNTGNWGVAANWTGGSVPTTADTVTFNVNNAAECVVNTSGATCSSLRMGDNGTTNGNFLRIANGGELVTASTGFNVVGYNRSATMIVEAGGYFETAARLGVGWFGTGTSTLTVGGDVVINGTFQVGTDNAGVSYPDHDGIVELVGNGSILVHGGLEFYSGAGSTIDIENGTLVFDGNRTEQITALIQSGEITGFGGSGAVVVDYDTTNPGQTTVKAFDAPVNWHVAPTTYVTNELVITPYDADALATFGIVADGVTDVTQPIQDALNAVSNLGGGDLFLPAGMYKVGGHLAIPSGVTLRGDWQQLVPGQPIVGTILMAYADRGVEPDLANSNLHGFIDLITCSAVKGVTIWYPEQTIDDVQPYPCTIKTSETLPSIEDVTFVNSYFAYGMRQGGIPIVRNVYGSPLKTGMQLDGIHDVGRIETVHFAPDYWADSGLDGAPNKEDLKAWTYQNGTGVILGRLDWTYLSYVTLEGYNKGVVLENTVTDTRGTPDGQYYDFNLIDCRTGVYIEMSESQGNQFTRFTITGAEIGIDLAQTAGETNMFHSCDISATKATVLAERYDKRVLFMSCTFRQSPFIIEGGGVSVMNSDFESDGAHIILDRWVKGASILGNRFSGEPRIVDNSLYPVEVDHTPIDMAPLPAYDYKTHTSGHMPANTNLYVVTEAPFNAAGDGVTDDTTAFLYALAVAKANGGGTVFFPAGEYRLNGTLTIPSGVELRGVNDQMHDTRIKGSCLDIYSGKGDPNGVPFIQIEANAGIRDFNCHYPEQIYDADDNDPITGMYGFVPYPPMVRGLGSDIYVVDLAATIPYYLLDLATVRCDRHYVNGLMGCIFHTGVNVSAGSDGGQLQNFHFHRSAYSIMDGVYDSIPSGQDLGNALAALQDRDGYPLKLGNVTNQIVHEYFTLHAAEVLRLYKDGGNGPSGIFMGGGGDNIQKIALGAYGIGAGGFDIINMQNSIGDGGVNLTTDPAVVNNLRVFNSVTWGGLSRCSADFAGGNIQLQLYLTTRLSADQVFKVENNAHVDIFGGTLHASGTIPYLTIDPTATATIEGNLIASDALPVASANVTVLGNVLRWPTSTVEPSTSWNSFASNQPWNVSGNWTSGVPNSLDHVFVSNNAVAGPVITTGTAATMDNLLIGDSTSSSDSAAMTGGSLNTVDWLALGFYDNNSGALSMSGGSASIGSDLYVGLRGAGTFTMTGGSATIAHELLVAPESGSSGSVSLQGGQVNAGSLSMTAGGSLDVSGGTLVLDGDARTTVHTYISNGWLTANSGAATPAVDYNGVNPGKTTIAVCGLSSDFNCDLHVDLQDLMYMAGVWLTDDTTADIALPADGTVSLPDFSVLSSEWSP